jgi:hypothetical protein
MFNSHAVALYSLVCDPITKLKTFGSPGITWAFFIGWFERGGKKTELLE